MRGGLIGTSLVQTHTYISAEKKSRYFEPPRGWECKLFIQSQVASSRPALLSVIIFFFTANTNRLLTHTNIPVAHVCKENDAEFGFKFWHVPFPVEERIEPECLHLKGLHAKEKRPEINYYPERHPYKHSFSPSRLFTTSLSDCILNSYITPWALAIQPFVPSLKPFLNLLITGKHLDQNWHIKPSLWRTPAPLSKTQRTYLIIYLPGLLFICFCTRGRCNRDLPNSYVAQFIISDSFSDDWDDRRPLNLQRPHHNGGLRTFWTCCFALGAFVRQTLLVI